jgi:hypothetical protein
MKTFKEFTEAYKLLNYSLMPEDHEYNRLISALLYYKDKLKVPPKSLDPTDEDIPYLEKTKNYLNNSLNLFNQKYNYYINNTYNKFLLPYEDYQYYNRLVVFEDPSFKNSFNSKKINYKETKRRSLDYILFCIKDLMENFINGQSDYKEQLISNLCNSNTWKYNEDIIEIINDFFGDNGIFLNKELGIVFYYNHPYLGTKKYITDEEANNYMQLLPKGNSKTFKQILNEILFAPRVEPIPKTSIDIPLYGRAL